MILGYGGLGKTLATSLKQQNLQVAVANRTLKSGVDVAASAQEMLEMLRSFDVVVNATKIGTLDDPGLSMEAISSFNGCFYDCTPRKSRIVQLIHSRSSGKAFNGLGMLVHQGVKSFEIWTGMKADVEAMRMAVIK